jgi:signal peptidase I
MEFKKILIGTKNLLIILLAAFLIKAFLIETSRVPTGSMEKTIRVGDFLFVNKFVFGSSSPRNIPYTNIKLPYFTLPALHEPERYDIVVFEYPGDRDALYSKEIMNYVKRLIGLPGDTIKIVNQVVYINGKQAWIPPHIQYLKAYPIPKGVSAPYIFPKNSGWNEDNYGPLVIPKKGDVVHLTKDNIETYRTLINRDYGRFVVTVEGDKIFIDGKETDSYKIKQNYFFMMGDNRDDSADSRFWGFVPRENIEGEAFMVYWSWDPSVPFTNLFKLLETVRWNRIGKIVH